MAKLRLIIQAQHLAPSAAHKSAQGRYSRRLGAGFTIVEMVISLVVAGILAVVIFAVTFYYYANTVQAQTAADLGLESQAVLSQLSNDLRLADAISQTNVLADDNQPGGGWVTSNPSNVIIIESPAVDASRNIIYDPNTGFPYRNELIYFIDGGSMYKRVLANPDATGNTQITTCPAAVASAACPPDRLFTSHINNLSFTLYDATGAVTNDFSQTRSVYLQVNLVKKVFGKTITLNNATRITLRNR